MSLTNSNRINIPAVCRIRSSATGDTVGTGVLVAPGILLTSRCAVGSHKEDAAALIATFFEGTKKRVVDVALLPDKYFFTAAYPDYMDYCLVACEEGPLINVVPIHVPLTQREWTVVCEGDIVLVVQHPIAEKEDIEEDDDAMRAEDGGDTGMSSTLQPQQQQQQDLVSVEQKRFEEVLRCRDNLYYLKTNGLTRTAGCPAFDNLGHLIGLQSQRQGTDGEGVVNRILSIDSIVKHMFAMKQLAVLPQQQRLADSNSFDDVWSTWFTETDITRVYTILANFRGKETVREVTRRLCEMTAKQSSGQGLGLQEDDGAISIILANLAVFPNDEELSELGLRALWNVSIGNNAILQVIAQENGVDAVVGIMERFPLKEEIAQFGAVLLCNMSDAGIDVFAQNQLAERLLSLLLGAVKRFTTSFVLQKFSLSLLTRLLRWHRGAVSEREWRPTAAPSPSAISSLSSSFTIRMVEEGMFEHAGFLLSRFRQGQIFLVERVLEFVAELAQDRKAVELSRGSGAPNRNDALNATALPDAPHYPTHQLIDILIDVMRDNVGNDTIMASGNAALWGLGNVPEYRAAILLNPQSQEVLRLSIPSLMASGR